MDFGLPLLGPVKLIKKGVPSKSSNAFFVLGTPKNPKMCFVFFSCPFFLSYPKRIPGSLDCVELSEILDRIGRSDASGLPLQMQRSVGQPQPRGALARARAEDLRIGGRSSTPTNQSTNQPLLFGYCTWNFGHRNKNLGGGGGLSGSLMST